MLAEQAKRKHSIQSTDKSVTKRGLSTCYIYETESLSTLHVQVKSYGQNLVSLLKGQNHGIIHMFGCEKIIK